MNVGVPTLALTPQCNFSEFANGKKEEVHQKENEKIFGSKIETRKEAPFTYTKANNDHSSGLLLVILAKGSLNPLDAMEIVAINVKETHIRFS